MEPSLYDETFIAIDLETTGFSPHSDRIIEFGGIKFRGEETLETFSSLVNPLRPLDPQIVSLTGIDQRDLNKAPRWDGVIDRARKFLGDFPLVGHNINFDTSFLNSHQLKVTPEVYDTYDLAHIVLTSGKDYRLSGLAEYFGVRNENPHRALSDAEATMRVFLALLRDFAGLSNSILQQFTMMNNGDWPVGRLAKRILKSYDKVERSNDNRGDYPAVPAGLDVKVQYERTRPRFKQREISYERPKVERKKLSSDVEEIFKDSGTLSRTFKEFENRPEQMKMAQLIGDSLSTERPLIIEAGTGVGKSLAYLVPALIYSHAVEGRTVISTNTINLQEQLLNKDLPLAQRVVQEALGVTDLNVAQLKGRGNYLCYRRWVQGIKSAGLSEAELRVLAKCLVWLEKTDTGDCSAITLGWGDRAVFRYFSAEGADDCPAVRGPCFLRKARREAAAADVLIINHALLISDIVAEGGLLPSYSCFIIDEAHHLIDTATRCLGFEISFQPLSAVLERLCGQNGIITRTANAMRLNSSAPLDEIGPRVAKMLQTYNHAEEEAQTFFSSITSFVSSTLMSSSNRGELRITPAVRSSGRWEGVALAFENLEISMNVLIQEIDWFSNEGRAVAQNSDDLEAMMIDISAARSYLDDTITNLHGVFSTPLEKFVYWLRTYAKGAGKVSSIHGAPLDVSDELYRAIFHQNAHVILTGATLSYENSLTSYREQIGLTDADEFILGSPFDYKEAALVLLPDDVPVPNTPGYAAAQSRAIAETALATGGRTLALFTSRASLNQARSNLYSLVANENLTVVGQGIDGTPHQIMRMLNHSEHILALGLNSLWEGVDMPDASLDALIMTKLPFPVPSEPITSARSELYKDSFNEYYMRETVRRFRQGFGRLIRSRSDRGVFVVLDIRVLTKGYGKKFIKALPECAVKRTKINRLQEDIQGWLRK